jgi:hypothetical protein
MSPVIEWSEAYLTELIKLGEKESLTLDYKASAALKNQDKEKNDLSKDVSAFANSAGGILVYGMLENKHVPTHIDIGVDRNILTKEWLESVIKSSIQPIVEDVLIKQIELPSKGKDMVAYAIEIKQARSRAPHQAFDHKYYKRFNFESTPMEDYEVRDLMRRAIEYGKVFGTAWDLLVELRRIIAAAEQRSTTQPSDYLPRNRLAIPVSSSLRSSGVAVMALPRPLRQGSAKLINLVDRYNSIIETTDPGGREEARLNEPLRKLLRETIETADTICGGLLEILKDEP